MNIDILCQLLAEKINPEKFQFRGAEIKWLIEPTSEELEIVDDVIKNYKALEESYLREKRKEKTIVLVQAFMDAKAQEYGYDHILSATSYVTSTFPKFKAEGIAFAKWRDDVWLYCYSVLAEWEAGTSKITTEDELIASLPEFIVEY